MYLLIRLSPAVTITFGLLPCQQSSTLLPLLLDHYSPALNPNLLQSSSTVFLHPILGLPLTAKVCAQESLLQIHSHPSVQSVQSMRYTVT